MPAGEGGCASCGAVVGWGRMFGGFRFASGKSAIRLKGMVLRNSKREFQISRRELIRL